MGGTWYVCIFGAEAPVQPVPPTGQETGIDLGLALFATLATGTLIHTPRCYRRAERRRKTAHRRVARRKQGSARRRKTVQRLAKAHQPVKRQRQDFQRRLVLEILPLALLAFVRDFAVIDHADLQVAPMLKNHPLAKSLADAGGSGVLRILTFTAACAGKRVAGRRGESCRYQSDVFWLRRYREDGLLGPLARLPGLRNQPAPRPQRRQE